MVGKPASCMMTLWHGVSKAAACLRREGDGGRLVPRLRAPGDRNGSLRRQPRFLLHNSGSSVSVSALLSMDIGQQNGGRCHGRRTHGGTAVKLPDYRAPTIIRLLPSGRRMHAGSQCLGEGQGASMPRTLRRRSSASLARSRAPCHLITSFSDIVPTSSSRSASRGLLDE